MKKLFLVVVAICVVPFYVFAQETVVPMATATPEGTITLKGIIIDNMCAGLKTPEELTGFVKTHTKQCALMPNCLAGGYSILVDGKLIKFDKESSAKIEKFLKKEDSKLEVEIIAKMEGEELSLISIENQGTWHTFTNDSGSIYGNRLEKSE